ncbi:MAG TPA: hypothetical protein VHJ83_15030, partial [Micromonosporaceae bacterium]|nr:hypothetical protein [Micromonosporaceae bacterium]
MTRGRATTNASDDGGTLPLRSPSGAARASDGTVVPDGAAGPDVVGDHAVRPTATPDRRHAAGSGSGERMVSDPPPEGSGYDEELLEEVPSRERLVAEAMDLAAGVPGLPDLIDRYWRLVPDEELFGRTGRDLYQTTVAHRDLAEQRLPG